MPLSTPEPKLDTARLRRLANTIRGLSIDGVEKANSGHPGLPLGCADLAALLWLHFLNYDPKHPEWPNRDRFVLSGGHGSMLLYSVLHLAGYDLPMEQLKSFRQLHSMTPGHPELGMAPGVETTTGPLGQGFGNGAGMALAAELMAARFNRDGARLVDHWIYGIVSDGDLMEGVASEAASLSGHLGLGRIIYFYDDNEISLDGPCHLSFSEDRAKRFEAHGWHVTHADGHNFESLARAIVECQAATDRPSIVCMKTHIGFGSPKQDTHKVHGSPLGKDALKATKEKLGLSPEDFHVPAEDREVWAARAAEGARAHAAWKAHVEEVRKKQPALVEEFHRYLAQALPDLAALRPKYDPAKPLATRKSASMALNAYGPAVPWLVGGSADLSESTAAFIEKSGEVKRGDFTGRHLFFGVREHAMGSMANGMTLYGGLRAYTATFLQFADYMRPTIRLAALMKLPTIFIFTHDSVFLGEDGPTHQPVEHLAALRTIPRATTIRPGDAAEAAVAWEAVLENKAGPTCLVLSRQNMQTFDRDGKNLGSADGVKRGAYVLKKESAAAPRVILIGTGSELGLAYSAAEALETQGVPARVVSMPSWELFRAQPKAYRDEVLPPACKKRLSVEAGVRMGWLEWVGAEGDSVSIDTFGESAPAEVLAKHFGFTVDDVVKRAKAMAG